MIKKGDRIKIVSDGTIEGTKVLNSDGELIPRVQKLTVSLSAIDTIPKANLTILIPELELTNVEVTEVEEVKMEV